WAFERVRRPIPSGSAKMLGSKTRFRASFQNLQNRLQNFRTPYFSKEQFKPTKRENRKLIDNRRKGEKGIKFRIKNENT
ncbi:hypothetical protein, partial [Pseudomonas aeruginosa]|uniref:hypothetical protein n=1 Tax=Pseudomonas aeruginosa TaxID=287 RepID=UPI002B23ABBB